MQDSQNVFTDTSLTTYHSGRNHLMSHDLLTGDAAAYCVGAACATGCFLDTTGNRRSIILFFVCEPADSVTVCQLGCAQCANGSGDFNDVLHHHHPNEMTTTCCHHPQRHQRPHHQHDNGNGRSPGPTTDNVNGPTTSTARSTATSPTTCAADQCMSVCRFSGTLVALAQVVVRRFSSCRFSQALLSPAYIHSFLSISAQRECH
ncbi:hypothetical protein SCLCIDRAFT_1092959 [Scleroderma citrinum Foug A]|uniref:Uncharacterized protein n=1 Tax=Scleroderma citrinum Foug A TaxID=1036808 RepID=A0A0C3A0V5_9AGAM|nr:hypothetical protein SCLCIDRAFT_1092959 [Scleroderma citrinum Foug A]